MRKVFVWLCACIVIGSFGVSAVAAKPSGIQTALAVYVDGRKVDEEAIAVGQTAYVRIDVLARVVEGVSYEVDNDIVFLTVGSVAFTYRAGESFILVDGKKQEVADVAWKSSDDANAQRFVPLSWMEYVPQLKVLIDALKRAVLIYRPMQRTNAVALGKDEPTKPLPPVVPAAPRTGPRTVMIDAGHGGQDNGATSVRGRFEKDFNLSIAQQLFAKLSVDGVMYPRLMRATDEYIAPLARANIANEAAVDVFVSIHANAAPSPLVSGLETYYWRDDSVVLAEVLHRELRASLGSVDRGVRKQRFAVVRETRMPAVLLELGFLSNAAEEQLLFLPETQQRIVDAIVRGLYVYDGQRGP